MSTRAQIGFYPSETDPITTPGTVYIYQHFDGDPAHLLPLLTPFARDFHKKRGFDDPEYATARCLVLLAHAQQASTLGSALEEYLGLGVSTVLNRDLSFYHVSPTRIGVYAVQHNGSDLPDFRLTQTVALSPAPSSPKQAIYGEGA